MRHLLFAMFLSGLLLSSFQIAVAQESTTATIFVFARADCRHCEDEKEFLNDLTARHNDIRVIYRDVYDETDGKAWKDLAAAENLPLATPITVVGGAVIQGFDTAETTGKRIETLADGSIGKNTPTPEEIIAAGGSGKTETIKDAVCDETSEVCATPVAAPLVVSIPFFGAADVGDLSIGTLSAVLGFVDGFNPCAMWVLVTFLLILSRARSRRRMVAIAGLFIVAESVMYYLILNVWFTTWNFVGLDQIVTPLIGVVAMGGGLFFLWEWKNSNGTCKIVGQSRREKIMRSVHRIVNARFSILTALGIISLALSVNIIEFACSIGIPQAFTKILELNHPSFFAQQFFTLIYIFFYMVDDLIVFALALWGINKIALTAKYSRWTTLIGGILMLAIGFLLIFAPDALQI